MKRVKVSAGRFIWVSDELLEKARRLLKESPARAELARLGEAEEAHPGVQVLFGRPPFGAQGECVPAKERVSARKRDTVKRSRGTGDEAADFAPADTDVRSDRRRLSTVHRSGRRKPSKK